MLVQKQRLQNKNTRPNFLDMIRLIVGLGNPGKLYERTRHNAGAWFVEQLCQEYHSVLRLKSNFYAQYTPLQITESLHVHLAIPTTFVNHSGRSVKAIAHYYKIDLEEILIVHDELDFLPGVVQLKLGGGSGGHNGLKDIIALLGGNGFWRLRIGIGHPGNKLKVPRYVLDAPQAAESKQIQQSIQNALATLSILCAGDSERAMQILHSA